MSEDGREAHSARVGSDDGGNDVHDDRDPVAAGPVVLVTKLRPPTVREGTLPRESLFEVGAGEYRFAMPWAK